MSAQDKADRDAGEIQVVEVGPYWYVDHLAGSHTWRNIGIFNTAADARLFAAAPQMYEALEGCVKTLHYVNTLRVVETNSLKEVLDAARTALRAANPEQSTPDGQASEPGGDEHE